MWLLVMVISKSKKGDSLLEWAGMGWNLSFLRISSVLLGRCPYLTVYIIV